MRQIISNKLIKEEMDKPLKSTYKDVGTCLRYKGKQAINRSKFRTATDAQKYLDNLLSIGVINPTYVVYKCPECHLWHVGLKEWSEK